MFQIEERIQGGAESRRKILSDINEMRQKGTAMLDKVGEVQKRLQALHKRAEELTLKKDGERDEDPHIFWVVRYQV